MVNRDETGERSALARKSLGVLILNETQGARVAGRTPDPNQLRRAADFQMAEFNGRSGGI